MQVRNFKLFTARELGHIQALLETNIQSWSSGWFTGHQRTEINGLASCEQFLSENTFHVAAEWFVSSISEDRWTAVLPSASLDGFIKNILIETHGSSTHQDKSEFASPLTTRLLFDLAEYLMENSPRNAGKKIHPQQQKQILAADTWGQGAAAIYGALSIKQEKIYFVLSPEIVNDYLSSLHWPRRELVKPMSINKAIDPVKLSLEISLGEAELSVAELRQISVGDVIRLNTRLDQPMDVLLGKKPICSAFLGAHQGNKAVLLMSSS